MRQIYCPKCGANTEYDPDTLQDLFLSCSQCGSMIPLMDSQVITIADGSLQGPGMRNLEEQEQDFVVKNGKAVVNSTSSGGGEFVIPPSIKQKITVKSPSLNPLQTSNLATVEEAVECKIDIFRVKPAPPPAIASRYSIKPSGTKPSQPGAAAASRHSNKLPLVAIKKPKIRRKRLNFILIWIVILLVIIDLLILVIWAFVHSH